jgi:UDP-sugar diphosphatase
MKVLKITKLEHPKYVKPFLLDYEYKGEVKKWEMVQTHNSVATLVYHEDKDVFIIVKQFRPAVFHSSGEKFSHTYELCAGLDDKGINLAQTAAEELEEEIGYKVNASSLQKITSTHTAVGFSGAKQTIFYTKVNDTHKIGKGGGIDGEDIEVIYLPLNEAKTFMFDESKPKTPALLFCFMWFFENLKEL